MIIVIVLILVLAILAWLFFSPLALSIDTTVPEAKLTWKGIGKALLIYKEDEWLLFIRVLFFTSEKNLSAPKKGSEKKKKGTKKSGAYEKAEHQEVIKERFKSGKKFYNN